MTLSPWNDYDESKKAHDRAHERYRQALEAVEDAKRVLARTKTELEEAKMNMDERYHNYQRRASRKRVAATPCTSTTFITSSEISPIQDSSSDETASLTASCENLSLRNEPRQKGVRPPARGPARKTVTPDRKLTLRNQDCFEASDSCGFSDVEYVQTVPPSTRKNRNATWPLSVASNPKASKRRRKETARKTALPVHNNAAKNTPLEQSVGRSRKWLNDHFESLEKHGIFAKFGQPAFATYTKEAGSLPTISHFVLKEEMNDFVYSCDEMLHLFISKGKTERKRKIGRALASMEKSLPVFYDYGRADLSIHYVGHWKPIPSTAVEFEAGNLPEKFGKERVMKIDFKFEKFSKALASTMAGDV